MEVLQKKSIDNERIKQNSMHIIHDGALLKLFPDDDDETENEEKYYTNLPIKAFARCNIGMLK